MACVDSAPMSSEYKLLQLRQYVSGEARKAIENLGHSVAAYEAAKERLDRKFGGQRRVVARQIEQLEAFPHVRGGSARDLEKLADLLDVTVINMREAGRNAELGDSVLYSTVLKKLPESLVTQYQRYLFEQKKSPSLCMLRDWLNLESEFQVVAHESVSRCEFL